MKRKDLPKSVKLYVQKCGGVIVGGAADPAASIENVADIDVLVPFSKWGVAAAIAGLINATGVRQNSYGGLRYTESNGAGGKVCIDVWPQELALFMGNGNVKFIWFPQHDYRWSRGDMRSCEAGSGMGGAVSYVAGNQMVDASGLVDRDVAEPTGRAKFDNSYSSQSPIEKSSNET